MGRWPDIKNIKIIYFTTNTCKQKQLMCGTIRLNLLNTLTLPLKHELHPQKLPTKE